MSLQKDKEKNETENVEVKEEMEDGECSDTESENSSDEESNASTATASDDGKLGAWVSTCAYSIIRMNFLTMLATQTYLYRARRMRHALYSNHWYATALHYGIL